MRYVDLTDPQTVFYIQCAYGTSISVVLLVHLYLWFKINQIKGLAFFLSLSHSLLFFGQFLFN